MNTAVDALSALGQITRLEVFRLLVRHEPVGLAAGEIAAKIGVPQTTLSAHLSVLSGAGLVTHRRQGRSLVYRASVERFRELTGFLFKDCCGGRPEFCQLPVIAGEECCQR